MIRFLPIVLLLFSATVQAAPLPGTRPLTDKNAEAIADRVMDGAHAFVDQKIDEAVQLSHRTKLSDHSREHLQNKLGVVDERPKVRMEFFSDAPISFEGKPATSLVAEGPGFEVHSVRWTVLPELFAEGLLVTPVAKEGAGVLELPETPPAMILFPDADETPEDIIGLNANLPGEKQIAARFAAAGFRILIPAVLSRATYTVTGEHEKAVARSDQSHREWIYRQAFQMGRHPIGYEIQTALAGVDWLLENNLASSITVGGYGEGGRSALYAAAVDTRIDHAFVSGAFAPRDRACDEPIYRNIFALLPEHSDAAIAALIAPRPLLIEHTLFPEVTDQKGSITTPAFSTIQTEFDRISTVLGTLQTPPSFLLHHAEKGRRADYPSVAAFLQTAGIEREISRIAPFALLIDSRAQFSPEARQLRILASMEKHVQSLIDQSDEVRRESFFLASAPELQAGRWSTEKTHPILDPTKFLAFAEKKREQFHSEVIGRFDENPVPLAPQSRKILETDSWTAWDVVMEVYSGFEAWGVLLLPKGIEPGEKRPVVVCQHGRNGLPRDTVDAAKSAYNDFAAKLAERGFITFAPHNIYRGEDRYRWLDRKANLVGCSLFSFITASHRKLLQWLATLPEVDAERIAFYGLSYGGETAVRVPALLPEYCLSICSGDFNQWTRKVGDSRNPHTFMRTIEWEMPYWNMGNTFDYGDLAGLIFPRPFFVERGHNDRVARDEWVAYEYARVRRLYTAFGKSDLTGIEYFLGGHSINGQGSFDFLHRHLDLPVP